MKFRFILVSLFFGFSVYSLLNLFWGPCGLERMYAISDYRSQIKEDIGKLQSMTGHLEAQIKLLAMNRDYIDAQAMELGYLDSHQGYIHLDGYSPEITDDLNFALAQNTTVTESPQNLLRGISLCVTAALILLFYLFSLPDRKEEAVPETN